MTFPPAPTSLADCAGCPAILTGRLVGLANEFLALAGVWVGLTHVRAS
jgi:hypothetical protein